MIGGGLRRYRRQTVVIHTRDDRSIKGVLLETYRDCFVLDAGEYLDEANPVGLDGRPVVPRENVSWIQVL